MAIGIIIHVSVDDDKRTQFFSDERIRVGSDGNCNLQIQSPKIKDSGTWLEFERENGGYRLVDFDKNLNFTRNDEPLHRYVSIKDGDVIASHERGLVLSFYSLDTHSSIIKTTGEAHVAQFIEAAALESSTSEKRDDAKTFLKEFMRELSREISWTTKVIGVILATGLIFSLIYLGFSVSQELRKNREQSEQQSEIIRRLEEQLAQTNLQLGDLDKTNKDIIKTVSLAPNLRVEYGSGVCLIVGVYDLVDRKSGKPLRYPEPQASQRDPYEPEPMEEGIIQSPIQPGLTTEGNGTPVEYDFIGTGFHVGSGYIATNRHVVRPWEEDELVQQLMRNSNGRARVKRLNAYFPNFPQPIAFKLQQFDAREDLAVGTIDPNMVSPDIPVLPIDAGSDAAAVGKTVVTMGYPNGPDRLLAMVDDVEAKTISARFGGSRQALINYLAQTGKIVPLTTQGAITDLDGHRIVHDARTAEGGSGAPLFGQSGKVIGVNFGVFTENTAANMAVPIRYAVELLRRAGWKSPEEIAASASAQNLDSNKEKTGTATP